MTVCLTNKVLSPQVFLAPMAGITDLPFRRLVARFGAGLVVSEMVASQEMVQSKPGVREKAELGFDQAGTAVQLAGREAHWMAEAARQVAASRSDPQGMGRSNFAPDRRFARWRASSSTG